MNNGVKHFILIAILFIGLGAIIYIKAYSTLFSYGGLGICSLTLSSDGSKLYAPYYEDDKIVEIDTSTMQQIRQVNCDAPYIIKLSPDDQYLYAILSGDSFKFIKINLSNMSISEIQTDYYGNDFCISPDGDTIWLIGAVWPMENDYWSNEDISDHPGTGRLEKIDAQSFEVQNTVNIGPFPGSICYSDYMENIYVYHQDWNWEFIDMNLGYDWTSTVSVYNPNNLSLTSEFLAGYNMSDLDSCNIIPVENDSRYLIMGDTSGELLESAIIVDALTESILETIRIPVNGIENSRFAIRYLVNDPSGNYVWGVNFKPGMIHDIALDGQGTSIIKIDTTTYEYEPYLIEGVTDRIGNFCISPDGNTFYFPLVETGQIVEWHPNPPNNPPICYLTANTISYTGPAPATIHFDATMSYDPDPGDTLSYSWDFNNDGMFGDPYDSGTDSNPTKLFYQSGSYAIQVRVTDNHGAHSDCAIAIQINIE